MSEAAVKVLEEARQLSADDQLWVANQLVMGEPFDPDTFHPDQVPPEVQDEIMAEVERRMAEDEANPIPGRPWEEALADIQARFDKRWGGR